MRVSPYLGCKTSFYKIYMLLAVCLYIINKNVNALDTQYSDDIDITRGNLFHRNDSSKFNINLQLQEQTRKVVMMKTLPRIDPVKVRL